MTSSMSKSLSSPRRERSLGTALKNRKDYNIFDIYYLCKAELEKIQCEKSPSPLVNSKKKGFKVSATVQNRRKEHVAVKASDNMKDIDF